MEPKYRSVFAGALTRARERKGLTKADMARALGCTRTVITKIESGRCHLRETTVARYAAALGMTARLELVDVDDNTEER